MNASRSSCDMSCPSRCRLSSRTCSSTLAACWPPMTLIRALGHIHSWRGDSPAAHAVVAGAEAAADDDRELGHLRVGDGHDHLRAVAREAAVLVLPADHEPGDVLQEHERDPALAAQLDKVRALKQLSLNRMPLLATMPTG